MSSNGEIRCIPFDLQLKTKADETAILLARFRRMCGRFHPAVLAMYKAIRRRMLTDEDAGALASGFFTFLRALAPATIPDTQVFQHSRTGFYLLLRHSAVKERTGSERFVSVSLECPLTHKRLEVRVCWWSQSRVDILLLVGLIKSVRHQA